MIIVTGGAGFVGKYVVKRLNELGHETFVPRSADYDLRALYDVADMLRKVQPDMVIHMAASVGGIGANRANPARYYLDNLLMGTLLLDQSYRKRVRKFVTVGTVCSYPKHTPVPFKEDDLWNGYPEETNAPYGLAKKALLVQGQAMRQEYGFNSIHLLLVNVYGPGETYNPTTSHVIPDLIHKMLDAKEQGLESVTLWGDGSPTREFIYVTDAAEGIVQAALHYDKGEPVNIGSGAENSIGRVAQLIANLVDYNGDMQWDATKPNGQPRRRLDVSKALAEFGFRAQTNFDKGLQETVQWHMAQRERERA